METPYRLIAAAQRLKAGRRCNRITVRDFLSLFGAERRGERKVLEIRAILDQLGLQTTPDFETEWIDAPIWLKLKEGVPVTISPNFYANSETLDTASEDILEDAPATPEDAEPKAEELLASEPSEDPMPAVNIEVSEGTLSEDPTYRIGKLPAANIKSLITVGPNDPLMKAVTLMLQYDLSQLPIMQNDRDVRGMITWKSIGLRFAFGNKCPNVNDCREEARIINSDRTLFDAIPTIVEHGYVLVRKLDRRISGIVTASDLSLQFQALSEPFLLLREIELHVRRLLGGKVAAADFQILATPNPVARKLNGITDLTFGDYVRLFQHPDIWPKLDMRADCKVMTALLEQVRQIRNDVMHFDPDPMTAEELNTLKRSVRLLQELHSVVPEQLESASASNSS